MKILFILTASAIMGFIALLPMANGYVFDNYFIVFAAFIVFYICIVPLYILRKVRLFNRILLGTNEIMSGNFDYVINEKGGGALQKLAHNINNINAGLKNSLEKEMKSERLKTELITNVSHDLKTPLTSIMNYVDLLKREELSKEEMTDYIGIVDRKTHRLKVLIDDLFEASKMNSGTVELQLERVDIGALLHQTLAEFNEKIENSSLIFKVNVERNKHYAELDGKKTWRVFENLISNILKYSQPNTRVYIDLFHQDKGPVLIMKNIASYEMDFDTEEIFERFKRGDKSRHTEGSGLGLAIAKSIMELQGKELKVEVDGDLFKVIIEF